MKLSKSFEKGFSRAIDLFGQKKNFGYALNGVEKDTLALTGDWENVGREIARSISRYRSR